MQQPYVLSNFHSVKAVHLPMDAEHAISDCLPANEDPSAWRLLGFATGDKGPVMLIGKLSGKRSVKSARFSPI
jgi:hypothetical protein